MNKVFFEKSYTSGEHALTKAQVDEVLACTSDLVDLALFQVAVTTGIRRNDIVRLKWKDVNLEKGFIDFFEQKKDRVKRVWLNNRTLQVLKLLKSSQKDEYYLFPGRSEPKYGKGHISSKTAYNRFQRLLVEAGVQGEDDNKPFHALRATCVKLCQLAGWSVEKTAKHIGDTVSTVQKHYSTPSDEEMAGVVREKSLL